MDRITYEALLGELDGVRRTVSVSKSGDYATADVLSNFKRMNTLCNVLRVDPSKSPLDAAMFLILLKMDRINNLKDGRKPNNESIRDTIIDLTNYIYLWYGLWEERNAETESVHGHE
jgi:hypothetical protein